MNVKNVSMFQSRFQESNSTFQKPKSVLPAIFFILKWTEAMNNLLAVQNTNKVIFFENFLIFQQFNRKCTAHDLYTN